MRKYLHGIIESLKLLSKSSFCHITFNNDFKWINRKKRNILLYGVNDTLELEIELSVQINLCKIKARFKKALASQ